MNNLPHLRMSWLVMLVFLTAACAGPEFIEGAPPSDASSATPARTGANAARVYYRLDDGYWVDPPRCVVVLPPVGLDRYPAARLAVENAFARALFTRVKRVVVSTDWQDNARLNNLDLDSADGRFQLAKAFRCPHLLRIGVRSFAVTNALVWAEKRLNVVAELYSLRLKKVVWRGWHKGTASGGGISLSLLGLPMDAVNAARFTGDTEATLALLDMVARRLSATMPMVKVAGTAEGS